LCLGRNHRRFLRLDGLAVPTVVFALSFRRVGQCDERILALVIACRVVLAVAADGRLRGRFGFLRRTTDQPQLSLSTSRQA
jgi:hypothetical protein